MVMATLMYLWVGALFRINTPNQLVLFYILIKMVFLIQMGTIQIYLQILGLFPDLYLVT